MNWTMFSETLERPLTGKPQLVKDLRMVSFHPCFRCNYLFTYRCFIIAPPDGQALWCPDCKRVTPTITVWGGDLPLT